MSQCTTCRVYYGAVELLSPGIRLRLVCRRERLGHTVVREKAEDALRRVFARIIGMEPTRAAVVEACALYKVAG